jgi:predicted acyl esterase
MVTSPALLTRTSMVPWLESTVSNSRSTSAERHQDDTNFIMRLWDVAPDGGRRLITTGFLKASHRELDDRTSEGNPYHPHTRAVPVQPGKIEEYVLRRYPFAATVAPGHRLLAELSSDEPPADALLPPDAFHLPVGRPVTHKIYRDAAHRSRLVLPFTKG